MERRLNEALKDSIFLIMREAKKAFESPCLLYESSAPASLDDMSREEILKIIQDSLKSIRLYSIAERGRLVELMGEIGEWIDKSNDDLDLEDMDPGYFLDVMSPNEVKDRNTFQIAAVILRKLNYITGKEESEIMEGLRKNPEDDEHKSALEFLDGKVDEASRETGNEPSMLGLGAIDTKNLSKAKSESEVAMENLRRATMALYRSNLDSKTRKDSGTSASVNFALYNSSSEKAPIKSFEQDDLFNEFYIQLIEKTKKRKKARDGSFLPWNNEEEEDAFDSAIKDESGEHLDRYLQSMIQTKAKKIRKKRGSDLNPAEIDTNDSIPNRHRKRIIVAKDLRSFVSGSSHTEDSLSFYKDKMPLVAAASDSEFEMMKRDKYLGKEDKIRLDILRDLKYQSENSPLAISHGISMNPDRIYDSLSGYLMHILNSKREKRPSFASDLAKDDGSSDDAVASMSKAVGNVKREKPGEDSDPMNISTPDSQDSDSGLSQKSLSAAQSIARGISEQGFSLIEKFFRPYIIRAVKTLAASGGDRSAVQSVFLCMRYDIPCSFSYEEIPGVLISDRIKDVSINEQEIIDKDLDEKMKSYLFDKLGQESSGLTPSLQWKSWSDEHLDVEGRPKETQKTLRRDSFCLMFFAGQSPLYKSYKKPEELIDIMIHLPETSSGSKKFYRYEPTNFQSSRVPNGLMKIDTSPKSKTHGQLVPIYRISSVGEYLMGNPQGKRGAVSYLCDMVFEMITKDEVKLKDLMIMKNKEKEEEAAKIQAKREKDDEAYKSAAARSLPLSRPPLSSRPNPLSRFLKKNPEGPSPP